MSATEQLIERVKTLDEAQARTLLDVLGTLKPAAGLVRQQPAGARATRGWIKKYNHPYRTTAEWMHVLREGEKE